jgi:hypothetical protein
MYYKIIIPQYFLTIKSINFCSILKMLHRGWIKSTLDELQMCASNIRKLRTCIKFNTYNDVVGLYSFRIPQNVLILEITNARKNSLNNYEILRFTLFLIG